MKLTADERLSILQIVPTEGNAITLRIIREAMAVIGISEEEYKEFGITEQALEDGRRRIKWNEKGEEAREINIGDQATIIIADKIRELDKIGKLPLGMLSLYEKFVEGVK